MLTRIKLKNFRAFREEIDVRIRPITILIGRNSAGKSTLIKFLLMLQQTLESSEGDFFATEGRHVSLGTFSDLKNSLSRSNKFEFSLEIQTNDLPDPAIQQIREQLKQSKPVKSLEGDITDLNIRLTTSSTIVAQDPLTEGTETRVRVDSTVPATELTAEFCVFGSIPYGKSTKAEHTVTCKIGGKKVLKKEENNIRRTRFLSFPLPNNPVEIIKSAFDNLYLDGIRHEIISMRHLSPIREESERSVILGSPPPDDVGHRGEYSMPHLQKLLTEKTEEGLKRSNFALQHIESVIDIHDLKFKPQSKGFIPEFRARNKLTGAESYLADFGFGVSQCIPIFVQGALLNKGQLLIVEQPEAQIHPTAQLEMGSFFADLWNDRHIPSLIETHSSNIILRLRRLVSNGDLKCEDISIAYFYVKDEIVKVKNLDIRPDGSLEKGLPMEFFGADVIEALEL
jgi:energy-coupling factor transporter ATP-binding protein EcfA2